MVAAFDFCLARQGRRGAVDRHRDARARHRRRTSTTCIPTAASRSPPPPTASSSPRTSSATASLWVPWRRPGFQLGLDIAAIHDAHPDAVGVILGGHGITAWGATSDEAEANSRWIIETAAGVPRRARRRPSRSAPSSPSARHSPTDERRAKAAALAPHLRAIASRDHRMVGHYTDSDVVLEFLAGEKLFALAALGTSCPDHFLRTKVKPLVLDLPASASVDECVERLARAARAVPRRLPRVLRTARRRRRRRAMRGADPAIILVPGVGMFSYGRDKQTRADRRRVLRQRDQRHARRGVGVDLRADRRAREVPHRVLGARGSEAAAAARSRSATPAASRSSRARRAASAGRSRPDSRPTVRASSSPTSTPTRRARPPRELGSRDVAVGVAADVHRRRAGARGRRRHGARPSAASISS